MNQFSKPAVQQPCAVAYSGHPVSDEARSQRKSDQVHQGVVQLVGVANGGPGASRFFMYSFGVQSAQVPGVVRQGAPQWDGPGPALLQRRVVQEGVGHGVEQLVREHRRLHRVPGVHLNLATLDACQHFLESRRVHCLREAVADGLEDQGMVRRLDVARRRVILACYLGREDGGQQVFGPHPQQGKRHLPTAGVTQHGQRPGGVPSPSHPEERHLKDCLHHHLLRVAGGNVGENVLQRE